MMTIGKVRQFGAGRRGYAKSGRAILRVVGALALLGLLVAACGDDDTGGASAPSSLTTAAVATSATSAAPASTTSSAPAKDLGTLKISVANPSGTFAPFFVAL